MDWSAKGLGAVLSQEDDDGKRYVVEYYSRGNTPAESNYGSFKGEAATLTYACRHWRHYLLNGKQNIYETDNAALQWLMTAANLPPMAARWALLMSEFDFKVKHIEGKQNVVADHLSRPQQTGPPPKAAKWPTFSAEVMAIEVLIGEILPSFTESVTTTTSWWWDR